MGSDETARLLVPITVRWRPDGPLAARYGECILKVFFNSTFAGAKESQDFLTGALTDESFEVVKRKQEELMQLFEKLALLDFDSSRETEIMWLYSGIRPWDLLSVIA